VALAVDPEVPRTLAAGRRVVLVSATNGKTATTSMLTAAWRGSGEDVTTNANGANLLAGMTSALAADRTAPAAVLECDEANLPFALDLMSPELLVLGNLSRDQLDRHLEVRRIAERWRSELADHPTAVVASNSDPNVAWAVAEVADVTWVDTGLVSRLGLIAFASSLDQVGPFASTVADAALVCEVVGGHDAAYPGDTSRRKMDSIQCPNGNAFRRSVANRQHLPRGLHEISAPWQHEQPSLGGIPVKAGDEAVGGGRKNLAAGFLVPQRVGHFDSMHE